MNQAQYDLMFRLLIEGSTSLYLKGDKTMTSAPAMVCISLMEALKPGEREKLVASMEAAKDEALYGYMTEVGL